MRNGGLCWGCNRKLGPSKITGSGTCAACGWDLGDKSWIAYLESRLKSAEEVVETLDWLRQTVHRAHHDEESLEDCRKNSCVGAKQALARHAEGRKG